MTPSSSPLCRKDKRNEGHIRPQELIPREKRPGSETLMLPHMRLSSIWSFFKHSVNSWERGAIQAPSP